MATKKLQLNIRLERDLYDYLQKKAKKKYKTVTAVVREMIVESKEKDEAAPLIIKNND